MQGMAKLELCKMGYPFGSEEARAELVGVGSGAVRDVILIYSHLNLFSSLAGDAFDRYHQSQNPSRAGGQCGTLSQEALILGHVSLLSSVCQPGWGAEAYGGLGRFRERLPDDPQGDCLSAPSHLTSASSSPPLSHLFVRRAPA